MRNLLLIFISLLILYGCHSTSKDDLYNNMGPDEIYKKATRNLKKKDYALASEDFTALESRYPFGEYADKAQFGSIYALYQNEDYSSALPAVERFIRMYPRHPHVDYAYYMKGLIHFSESLGFFNKYIPLDREDRDTTSARKAFQAFTILISHYPSSEYVEDAKLRVVFLRNLLAQHELAAARFYMKKGAYLSAANRANYVISQFDRSPSIPEALAIQIDAYRHLHLDSLANDTRSVLVLNYPDSIFLKKLG